MYILQSRNLNRRVLYTTSLCSFNLSAAPMAISDEAKSLGQPPLEHAIIHTPGALLYNYNYIQNLTLSLVENDPSTKKDGSMISNSERPLKIPMATIDDEQKLKGEIGIAQKETPLGSTYTIPQHPEIPAPEVVPAVVAGTEAKVITSGAPVESAPILDDHLPHEPLTNSMVPTCEYALSHQPPPVVPLVKAASALESHGTRSSFTPSSSLKDIYLQDNSHEHTIFPEKYTQLLKGIRGLPNFNNFLQPHKATNLLSSLPSDDPVIILNVSGSRCDALSCRCGIASPLHIPLKNFSYVEAEKLRDRLQSDLLKQREAEDGDRASRRAGTTPSSIAFVLKELWHKVIQPVLEGIGYSVSSADYRTCLC